jgi:hypothetical protein
MDQTQLPPDGGQPGGSEDRQPSDALPAASPIHIQTSNEHDDFPEDALLEDEAAGWSAQFVVPFQQSGGKLGQTSTDFEVKQRKSARNRGIDQEDA